MAERPKDNNVFIYMHIHHVSQIETVHQTFDTKFYLRATWVQPLRKILTPEIDVDNWPNEIYKPQLDFDNAKEIIELKEQSLAISDWRKVTTDQSGFDTERFNYFVMEWKATGFGTFTYRINLDNYPYDLQMLKVTIGSKIVK